MTTTPTHQNSASDVVEDTNVASSTINLTTWGGLSDGDVIVIQTMCVLFDAGSDNGEQGDVLTNFEGLDGATGQFICYDTLFLLGNSQTLFHRAWWAQVLDATSWPATLDLTYQGQGTCDSIKAIAAAAFYSGAGDYLLSFQRDTTPTACRGKESPQPDQLLSGDLAVRGHASTALPMSAPGGGHTLRWNLSTTGDDLVMALADIADPTAELAWSGGTSSYAGSWTLRVFEDTSPGLAESTQGAVAGLPPTTVLEL